MWRFIQKGVWLVSFYLIQLTSAYSGAIYSSTTTAALSPNSTIPQGIVFTDVDVFYDAFAVAVRNGSAVIDSALNHYSYSGEFDSLSLLLSPMMSNLPTLFDNVDAVNGGAQAHGRMEGTSSANVARFSTRAFGHVTEPVEESYSRVSFNILLAFRNVSTTDLSVAWDINYLYWSNTTGH